MYRSGSRGERDGKGEEIRPFFRATSATIIMLILLLYFPIWAAVTLIAQRSAPQIRHDSLASSTSGAAASSWDRGVSTGLTSWRTLGLRCQYMRL